MVLPPASALLAESPTLGALSADLPVSVQAQLGRLLQFLG